MNIKGWCVWWSYRILLLRWWTGCGGEGYTKNSAGDLAVCYRNGCH